MSREQQLTTASTTTEAAKATAPIDLASLMQDRREVTILHAGERYRLRITANNKLILTK